MRWARKLQLVIPAVLVATAACGAPTSRPVATAPTTVPDKPSKPVELNILDVAGNLQLTQGMIDEFVAENPDIISKVNYTKATAPEMPGKLQAEQHGGQSQTHLVLTGTDGLSAVIEQELVLKLLPDFDVRFPNLEENYLPAAADDAATRAGTGRHGHRVYPSGSAAASTTRHVVPDAAEHPPRSCWTGRRPTPASSSTRVPANSGPGRTFLHGPAVHPRRQGPEGPGERLGEDLGLPRGARRVRSTTTRRAPRTR